MNFYEELKNTGDAVEFMNKLFRIASETRVTDIHFDASLDEGEPTVTVRCRIDGILRDVIRLESVSFSQSVLNAIKIASNIDVSQKKKYHDGRFSHRVGDFELDIRTAVVPTFSGEKIALRLLDKRHYFLDLEELGMPERILSIYRKMISVPQGFIVVAGPTGCGKTTTLYSTLKSIYSREKNIITIEDPVECNFPGVNQIQVDPEFGITFAEGLRAILRLDPDVIMIGEIRDTETARISFNASLTGCLIFSTLHAKNSINSISRLLDMGVEPFLIASGLTGVISQRLVRTICTSCKGSGCSACYDSGFRGRRAIYEFMVISRKIRSLILARANEEEIRVVAEEEGMFSFEESSKYLLEQGITTKTEIARVLSLDLP